MTQTHRRGLDPLCSLLATCSTNRHFPPLLCWLVPLCLSSLLCFPYSTSPFPPSLSLVFPHFPPSRLLGCSYFPECSVPLTSDKYSSNGRAKTLFPLRPLRTCLSTCPSLLSTDPAKSYPSGPFFEIQLSFLVDIHFLRPMSSS